MSGRQIGLLYLVATVVGWGLNWPVMKLLLEEWPPLFARGTSGLVAGLGLAALAWQQGERLAVPAGMRLRLCVASIMNVTAWMGLATLSMSWLAVAEAALIVYTMPIWATLFAWPILGTPPTGRAILALLLGIAGIAILLGGDAAQTEAPRLAGILCAFGAAVLFAFGTIAVRSPAEIPPIASTAWQLGIGSLPMIAVAMLFETPFDLALSPAGICAWLYLTVIAMGLCYLCWFGVLRRLPPTMASIGTMIIPVIGTLSATFIVGEPFGPRHGVALLLTLGGVALALRRA